MADDATFTQSLRITEGDLDPQRHVNNVAFLRFVQDAAVAHWLAVADPQLQAGITWVVRRHEIEYLRPAFLDEELLVRTWVGEPSGATWERFTEIVRPLDNQTLVKARTVWVLIDLASGRPRRVDARVTSGLRKRDSE